MSHFEITGCTVTGNTLTSPEGFSLGDGGGIDVSYTSASLRDSIISDNGPAFRGGGIHCSGGYSALTLESSVVSGNFIGPVDEGWDGGGVDIGAFCNATISNSVITGNLAAGSSSTSDGGGISFSGDSLGIYNTTVSGNEAVRTGGGISCSPGFAPTVTVVNSIFRGNTVLGVSSEVEGCTLNPSYSNIEGGEPGYPGAPWPGLGNVDVDVLFVYARPSSEAPTRAGNYRLLPHSPAIDAGTDDSTTFPGIPADDFEGHARPQGAGYDMGADEHVFRGDWNADGMPDLFWQHAVSRASYLWYMNGPAITGGVAFPTVADRDWAVGLLADFDGDGKTDILWRNTATGANYLWYMDGPAVIGADPVNGAGTAWDAAAAADFDLDGKPDLLWRNTLSGVNYLWYMDGAVVVGSDTLPAAGTDWSVRSADDFNGDGKPDILWRNTATGDAYLWYLDGAAVVGGDLLPPVSLNWTIDGTADFDGDGKPDICWRNYGNGENYLWYMDGVFFLGGAGVPPVSDPDWHIEQ